MQIRALNRYKCIVLLCVFAAAVLISSQLHLSFAPFHDNAGRRVPQLAVAAVSAPAGHEPTGGVLPAWLQEELAPLDLPPLLMENIRGNAPGWTMVQSEARRTARPRALLYLGWLAYNPHMRAKAAEGGPSGEYVYWADLTAGLVAIGYRVAVVDSIEGFWREIKGGREFSIVITDYDGLGTAENTGHFPAEHCRYFIVDGFGTQSAANAQRRRLDLKRILTPYPFDWSNTPINMMISTEHPAHWLPRERIGLLWAKDPRYIQRDHLPVLRRLAAMLPMHSFLTSVPGDFRGILINHVVVSRSDFTGFLQRARFIVGVGLPVDGPTALQAIAHGCVFINPARIPPTALPNKPNSRPYSSQHPYAEEHIKEPHVYTIDIADLDTLSRTVSTILDGDSSPFVHRWNSPQGYVDNLRGVFHNASCDSAHPPVAHPDNRVFASLDEQRLDDV